MPSRHRDHAALDARQLSRPAGKLLGEKLSKLVRIGNRDQRHTVAWPKDADIVAVRIDRFALPRLVDLR